MPKPDELIFAFKAFTGAMLALYLSFWLGLDNPYWSMATAYIVANPFVGAMRSKALYRFIGTITGGTAAVIMVPNLVNAPVLLCTAMALWVAVCLYLSLMDRSARSYVFMLAGYTVGIIGFPAVMDPAHVFQTALTRCEEITLGIVCTTLVGTIILPRSLGPVLALRVSSWVKPGIEWASAALAGEGESQAARLARRRLAFEAADTAVMAGQLAYDFTHMSAPAREVTRLRAYLVSLMPILSSVSQRVADLKRMEGLTPALRGALRRVDEWIKSGEAEGADPLVHELQELEEDTPDWPGLLRASLALRLEQLVRLVHQSRRTRQYVLEGGAAPAGPALEAEYVAIVKHAKDQKLAIYSGFSAVIAILTICAIWIQTSWIYGAGAATMVAVAFSFFAAQDDPAPAIADMVRSAVIVMAGVFVFDFGILPRVVDFGQLFLVLLPLGMIVGILVARPETFMTGMMLGSFGATQLALSNGYNANFTSFAEGALSLVIGLGSAYVITKLIRSFGAAWGAERLMRANWLDVAAAAEARTAPDGAALTGLMMDRLGLMMPRLAAAAAGADSAASLTLRDLRVGLDMIKLHREQWRLPPRARNGCRKIFSLIASYYRADPRQPAPPELARALDETIETLRHDPQEYRSTLLVLSGLRTSLYPEAPPPALNPQPLLMAEA
ncbi:FUSC family protein [Acidocella sp.]|uniref:FUSC family protein n=1 Tax=Acidocella sp. TaxID=50710 RepID=UPI002608E176|nr:FUSC family protein [Acidocella sp.]